MRTYTKRLPFSPTVKVRYTHTYAAASAGQTHGGTGERARARERERERENALAQLLFNSVENIRSTLYAGRSAESGARRCALIVILRLSSEKTQKKIGPTAIRTRDLPICSRPPYHLATEPFILDGRTFWRLLYCTCARLHLDKPQVALALPHTREVALALPHTRASQRATPSASSLYSPLACNPPPMIPTLVSKLGQNER